MCRPARRSKGSERSYREERDCNNCYRERIVPRDAVQNARDQLAERNTAWHPNRDSGAREEKGFAQNHSLNHLLRCAKSDADCDLAPTSGDVKRNQAVEASRLTAQPGRRKKPTASQ
jgi:hypothetical protein